MRVLVLLWEFKATFSKLQRDLKEVQRACESLNGTITRLEINSADPNSVNKAIRQMEAAIDSKIAPYRGNMLFSKMAQEMKNAYRKRIPERAKTGQK